MRATYDPASRGGDSPDGRKVKGTIHWVSAPHAHRAEVRLFGHLFSAEHPEDVPEGSDFLANLSPNSIEILTATALEPMLANAVPGTRYQFERNGYFCADPLDSRPGTPVFLRAVSLKDTWAKIEKKRAP